MHSREPRGWDWPRTDREHGVAEQVVDVASLHYREKHVNRFSMRTTSSGPRLENARSLAGRSSGGATRFIVHLEASGSVDDLVDVGAGSNSRSVISFDPRASARRNRGD
jgi:hypothetical protein